jgi:hypothetical protein
LGRARCGSGPKCEVRDGRALGGQGSCHGAGRYSSVAKVKHKRSTLYVCPFHFFSFLAPLDIPNPSLCLLSAYASFGIIPLWARSFFSLFLFPTWAFLVAVLLGRFLWIARNFQIPQFVSNK